MIETSIPSIDTEAFMEKVHEEIHKTSQRSSTVIAAEISSFVDQKIPPKDQQRMPKKEIYRRDDFFGFTDQDFVLNAFQVLLQRDPQPEELDRLLDLLSLSKRTKLDILGGIRYSPEGKEHAVHVKGLYLPFFIKRMSRAPVAGIFIKILIGIYRLPRLIKNIFLLNSTVKNINDHILKLENEKLDVHRYVASLRNILLALNDLEDKIYTWKVQDNQKIDFLLKKFEEKQKTEMDDFLVDIKKIRQEIITSSGNFMDEAVNAVNDEFTARIPDIVTVQRLLLEFEKNISPSNTCNTTQDVDQKKSAEHVASGLSPLALDSLYLSLENRFRGKTKDIHNRLKVYLPYVQNVLLNLPKGKALDVACGRGEWLEILQDIPMPAVGVDLNAGMLEFAKQRGLQVVCDDLFDYLQGVGDESLALISGFHIVEHLSFVQLVFLLDESFRSLQEGGLVIFETPNPENLLTGACNFYMDPTHRNPLPPKLLEFLLKARGFSRVTVLRLHPNDSIQLQDPIVQDLLFGPQDYAVLGWK